MERDLVSLASASGSFDPLLGENLIRLGNLCGRDSSREFDFARNVDRSDVVACSGFATRADKTRLSRVSFPDPNCAPMSRTLRSPDQPATNVRENRTTQGGKEWYGPERGHLKWHGSERRGGRSLHGVENALRRVPASAIRLLLVLFSGLFFGCTSWSDYVHNG